MNAKTNIKEHTLRVLFYVALLMEFSPRHSEPKASEAAPSISEVQSESPMGPVKTDCICFDRIFMRFLTIFPKNQSGK